MDNSSLQFDDGIMKLSAYDSTFNRYQTKILTLPELPCLESLESIFYASMSNNTSSIINSSNTRNDNQKPCLRLTKSYTTTLHNITSSSTSNNKRLSIISINGSMVSLPIHPRRCQSIPNLQPIKKQQLFYATKNQQYYGGPIRSKKSISGAFHAVAGFIQKATSKKSNNIRSSISWLTLHDKETSKYRRNSLVCENWWTSSPPIHSY